MDFGLNTPEVPYLQRQQTIAGPVQIAGRALHSGVHVNLRLLPLPPDSGIMFVRPDLESEPVKASPEIVRDTRRCMALGSETWRIQTVEHLMAALHGLDVDNVLIEVDGEEIPVVDGSALEFVKAIQRVGLVEQDCARRTRKLHQPVWVQSDTDPRSYLVALPALPGEGLRITYTFTSDHPATGNQVYQYIHTPENFVGRLPRPGPLPLKGRLNFCRSKGWDWVELWIPWFWLAMTVTRMSCVMPTK